MFIKTQQNHYVNSKLIEYFCVDDTADKFIVRGDVGYVCFEISVHDTEKQAYEALEKLVSEINQQKQL